jgi:hypothetical protein
MAWATCAFDRARRREFQSEKEEFDRRLRGCIVNIVYRVRFNAGAA